MKKRTFNFILIGIVVLAISALTFIHFTNDHMECEVVNETSVGANGKQIVVNKHICREKYNL